MPTFRSRRPGASTAAVVAVEPQGSNGSVSGGVPAFRVPRATGLVGVGIPGGQASYSSAGGANPHPLLDLSSVLVWRAILGLAAAVYIFGFHVTLGPLRVRIPRRA